MEGRLEQRGIKERKWPSREGGVEASTKQSWWRDSQIGNTLSEERGRDVMESRERVPGMCKKGREGVGGRRKEFSYQGNDLQR